MKRSGRASWVLIAGSLGVVLVAVLFFLGGETPTQVAKKFMDALAKGDVPSLTKLTYLPGATPEEIAKKWTYTVSVAGPHYRFRYSIRTEKIVDDHDAAVSVGVWRNYFSGIAFDEKYELSMVKENGKWRVDVRGINREMFPGLPR